MARAGIYLVLATLVVASFVVTPARTTAAPAVSQAAAARAMPAARSFARTERLLREADAPTPTAEPPFELTVLSAEAAEPQASPEPAPEPTPEPTPALPPVRPPTRAFVPVSDATTAGAETHMLGLINASRVASGLVPLAMDGSVSSVARLHSTAESQVRYVYHDGPDGSAYSRDVPACATGWYGENTGKVWNGNVDALHVEFMNEPWQPINHRTNIMDPNFRRVGIGAVLGPDAMYMTMVFCR